MMKRRLLLLVLAFLLAVSPVAALEDVIPDNISEDIVLEDDALSAIVLDIPEGSDNPALLPDAELGSTLSEDAADTVALEEDGAETLAEDEPAEDITVEDKVVEGDFEIKNGVLVRYLGSGGEVTIPEGITEIGYGVFRENQTITSVLFPSTLTKIGNSAFYFCTNLTGDLIIPDGVTSIGFGAFWGCDKLTGDLIIPDSVTSIGQLEKPTIFQRDGAC